MAHFPFSSSWNPSENAIAEFDKELGWKYSANLNRSVHFGSSEAMVYTDANGIRIPSPGFNLSSKKPSILFVGCSYTMGHGLSYYENFVGQLGAYVGIPYQVVNLGVQAYGTDQAYIALKKFVPRFNTKIVVYTFIGDHISRNGVTDRRLILPNAHMIGTKPLFELSGDDQIRLVKSAKRYEDYWNSYLLDALKLSLLNQIGLYPPYPEELTIRLIQHMEKYCKERGILFVLLNWRKTPNDYSRFSKFSINCIDTLEHAPPNWKYMSESVDWHPNSEAGIHVARLLRDYIKFKSKLTLPLQ